MSISISAIGTSSPIFELNPVQSSPRTGLNSAAGSTGGQPGDVSLGASVATGTHSGVRSGLQSGNQSGAGSGASSVVSIGVHPAGTPGVPTKPVPQPTLTQQITQLQQNGESTEQIANALGLQVSQVLQSLDVATSASGAASTGSNLINVLA